MNLKKINYIEKWINWIHSKTKERQFLIFSSILVGISAGIAAVILKYFVFIIRHYLVENYLLKYEFKYLYLILPLIGIGFTALIINTFFKESFHRGTNFILFAIAKKVVFCQTISGAFSTILCISRPLRQRRKVTAYCF